jgi:hypothetical protein
MLEMTRRQFAFWLGFGLFGLSEKLRLSGLDALAAAVMDGTKPNSQHSKSAGSSIPEHWTAADDETWTWFEREHFFDGEWMLTGTTTPVHKETGERKVEKRVYLDDSLLPAEMRTAGGGSTTKATSEIAADGRGKKPRRQIPTAARRGRHGRPPSKWLRSLHADELRLWLKTIEVPEAGVSGMTYGEHLTRDHSFDAEKIKGLIEAEQAKLHAAAHFGY